MSGLIIDLRESDKLYTLKDIIPITSNNDIRLSVISRRLINLNIFDDFRFLIKLNQRAPFFKEFSLYDNGFILAGGSVINILMGIDHINDFDLFPIFHNSKSIEQSITNLINHLKEFISQPNYLKIIKTKQALTLAYAEDDYKFKIQIICGIDIDFILRPKIQSILNILYNVCKLDEHYDLILNIDYSIDNSTPDLTPDTKIDYNDSVLEFVKHKKSDELRLAMCKHILDRFDIGASQVAWNGKSILMTKLGKFAIEYKSIIFDNKTYSVSTNYRIMKYQDRGFNLILPNANDRLLHLLPFIYIYQNGDIRLKGNNNKNHSIKKSNYIANDYHFINNNIIINNFINFCSNKLDCIIIINEYVYKINEIYLIIIKSIKKELKQKKYQKLELIFNKDILINLLFKEFNENLIKDILLDKLNLFINYMKTANFNLIHQVGDFNDLFDKRGIELKEWYGDAYISRN